MKLYEYEFKNVRVVLRNGIVKEGFVGLYIPAIDNDPPRESIGLLEKKNSSTGIEIYADQIESIECLS